MPWAGPHTSVTLPARHGAGWLGLAWKLPLALLFAISPATAGDWKVPPVPEDLRRPGIEISGPCSITSMFINALNPGPEGERAEGDLDDDEDSAGHRLVDTVQAAHNRLAVFQRDGEVLAARARAKLRPRR